MNAYLTGTGSFLPHDPVPAENIETILGMVGGRPSRARARILKANGIRTRHYAIDPKTGKTTHDNAQLTAEAVKALARRCGLDVNGDLALLACGTSTPDQFLPSHGSMVHGELGSPACEVMTASGGCCTSMAALKYAAMAVASGEARNAIATGSELTSALMRAAHFGPEIDERLRALEEKPYLAFEHDFLRWMLSDGAGALLIEPQPRRGMPSARIEWIEYLSFAGQMETCMYHGARKVGPRIESWKTTEDPRERVRQGFFNMGQDARLLTEHICRVCVNEALAIVLKKHPLRADEIDWLVPHYSSAYFKDEVTERFREAGLPIPPERHFTNLSTKGNTGAASPFIMLDELFTSTPLRSGQKILVAVPESARFSVAYMLLTVV